MSIEMVRFGEKLRFVKEIDPETLDMLVPSMMLQPMVENSIRHGLEQQSGRRHDPRAKLAWATAGCNWWWRTTALEFPKRNWRTLFEQGIGVTNVNERLKVLFGQDYRMWIDSKPGEGTRTGIEIPDVQVAEELTTAG